MFTNGVRRLILIVGLVSGVSSVRASPISYDFSGTLSQPYNGSTQFSGSFTYNTDLPAYPGITPSPGWAYYSGVPADPSAPPVSLTFNLGTTASSSFGDIVNDEVIVAHTQSTDAFFIDVQFANKGGQDLSAEIGFVNDNFAQRAPFNSSGPPTSLSLSEFDLGGNLTFSGTTADGHQIDVVGAITSLVAASSVPEPGPIVVVLAMGAGFLGYRRRSNAEQAMKRGNEFDGPRLGRSSPG
jgi:hypothetical protein